MKIIYNSQDPLSLEDLESFKDDLIFDARSKTIYAKGSPFIGINNYRSIEVNNIEILSSNSFNPFKIKLGANIIITPTKNLEEYSGEITINSLDLKVEQSYNNNNQYLSLLFSPSTNDNIIDKVYKNNKITLNPSLGVLNSPIFSGYLEGKARELKAHDIRNTNIIPNLYDAGFRFIFMLNTTDGLNDGDTYHGILHLRFYGSLEDFTGNRIWQLGFTDNGNICSRLSNDKNTWTSWRRLAYLDSNVASSTLVLVSQDDTSNANYPIIWAKPNNSESINSNLCKTWGYLFFNPLSKKLTSSGGIEAGNSILTTGEEDISLEWKRNGNTSWKIINTLGNFKIQTNYITELGTDYEDVFTLFRANAILRGNLEVGGDITIGSDETGPHTLYFSGLTGDNSPLYSFITERKWNSSEGAELLIFKGNDLGNGVSSFTAYNSGPDRIRHIAASHLFLSYSSPLSGTPDEIGNSTKLSNILDMCLYRMTSFVDIYLNGVTQVTSSGRATTWVKGRDNALLATTSYNGYSPIISNKTANGSWDIGTYESNYLHFSYITDSNYSSNNNTRSGYISFSNAGTIDCYGINSRNTIVTDIANAQFKGYRNADNNLNNRLSTNEMSWSYTGSTDSDYISNGFPMVNNANGILTFNTHTGSFGHLFGLSSNGNIYRRYNNGSSWSSWSNLWDSSNFNPNDYVTSLGVSGNYLTWTRGGVTNNITIPYSLTLLGYPLYYMTNGSSNSPYRKLITLKIIKAWSNTPVSFTYRGRSSNTETTVYIRFANSGELDPDIISFLYFGDSLYTSSMKIYKTATSTWEIWASQALAYDCLYISKFNATETILMTLSGTASSSLPSYIKAVSISKASMSVIATNLNPHTFWGLTFDGTLNISGNLSSVGSVIASNTLSLISSNSGYICLKYNNDDTKSLILNSSQFKPFDAANGLIDLGSSNGKWKSCYLKNDLYLNGIISSPNTLLLKADGFKFIQTDSSDYITFTTSYFMPSGTINLGYLDSRWLSLYLANMLYIGGSTIRNERYYLSLENDQGAKIKFDSSNFYYKNHTVAHSGNISSMQAGSIRCVDNRNATASPSEHGVGLYFDFKTTSAASLTADGGTYVGLLTMNKWVDNSGERCMQMGFTNASKLWIRFGFKGNSSWESWKTLATLQTSQTWTAYLDFRAGAGNSGSDIRFKKIYNNSIDKVLDDLLDIKIFPYKWIKEGETHWDTFGVDANQLLSKGGIYSKMVHERDDEEKTKFVDYDRFGLLAIKAILELLERVLNLERTIKIMQNGN